MLRTYIKIAWRTIYKNPLFAGINILGLSIGLCFTLLIGIYIWQENRVNTELRNLPNQYIIQSHWKKENLGIELTSIGALPKALKETYPHLVENYFRFDGITGITHVNQRNFRSSISIGDSSFFTMYGFELLQGNAATAFKQPSSVVLSEEAALKYFGRTDVLQESLELENFNRIKQPFQVTGVLKTATRNSVTQLNESNKNDLFLSTESLDFFGRNMSWDNPFIPSYVELKEGVKPETVEAAMNQLIRTHAPAAIAENLEAYLLPLTDYYQSANNQVVRRTNWILGMIGLFILIMALINFINLTISRSNNRLKEVGLRHVMGSNRWQLVKQFLLESVLLVTIALLFALVGYALLKNSFSAMVGKPMPSLQALTTGAWLLISLLVPAIGCVAGIYPAFYLSDIPVTNSLKKQLNSINQHHFIRKSLVGIQFVTAAVVLIGAVFINKQVDFFFSKELGFDKEQVLTVQAPRNWTREGLMHIIAARNEFNRLASIETTSLSYDLPAGSPGASVSVFAIGSDSSRAPGSQLIMCDEAFAQTYTIPVKAGTFFGNRGIVPDSTKIVINEAQVKAQGWKNNEAAIGQQVRIAGFFNDFTICGVVKDIHFGSMQESIQPQTFLPISVVQTYRYFNFKLKAGQLSTRIAELEKKWQQIFPEVPFEYNFLDDSLKKLYQAELQLKKAAQTALFLSIVLVLLGIAGLVSISLQKRIREIGIRRVLGASVNSIIYLFLKEFLGLSIISSLVAFPIAWWLLSAWLNAYTYRISLGPGPFLLCIGLLVFVTAVLISTLTYRFSFHNPSRNIQAD